MDNSKEQNQSKLKIDKKAQRKKNQQQFNSKVQVEKGLILDMLKPLHKIDDIQNQEKYHKKGFSKLLHRWEKDEKKQKRRDKRKDRNQDFENQVHKQQAEKQGQSKIQVKSLNEREQYIEKVIDKVEEIQEIRSKAIEQSQIKQEAKIKGDLEIRVQYSQVKKSIQSQKIEVHGDQRHHSDLKKQESKSEDQDQINLEDKKASKFRSNDYNEKAAKKQREKEQKEERRRQRELQKQQKYRLKELKKQEQQLQKQEREKQKQIKNQLKQQEKRNKKKYKEQGHSQIELKQEQPIEISRIVPQKESKLKWSEVPECLMCPITQTLMQSPYLLSVCGHTFQEKVIRQWLVKQQKCPLCNKNAGTEDLLKNFALAEICSSFK